MTTLSSTYWPINRQVVAYAVDTNRHGGVYYQGKLVKLIDEDSFYDSLYANHNSSKFESTLMDSILLHPLRLYFCAPMGSGKTSAVRYVKRQIANMHPSVHVELIDVKAIFDRVKSKLRKDPTLSTFDVVVSVLYDEFRDGLFNGPRERSKYAAWLAAGLPDDSDRFPKEVVADLVSTCDQIWNHEIRDAPTRMVRYQLLLERFNSAHSSLKPALKALSPNLRVPHVLQAFMSLNRDKKNLVIIYDNIDRLEDELTPKVVYG